MSGGMTAPAESAATKEVSVRGRETARGPVPPRTAAAKPRSARARAIVRGPAPS
jgi:hypothetical protein